MAESIPRRRLQDLVQQIDPKERLDAEVEELLLDLAEDFVESVSSFAAALAQHRQADSLDVKDLKLHVESHYNIRVPESADSVTKSKKGSSDKPKAAPKKSVGRGKAAA
eukprot:GILK01006929.1.p1 GENE.GILK01006929.1~~GILK01006929.1.p1  ORF type:complete len:122 (+),score=32.51 GILK01006929.1:42-368(+)